MPIFDFIIHPKQNDIELKDIQLSEDNSRQLRQLLREFKHIETLQDYGLPVDNKLLLFGHTGCGKTTTAIAIARELDKKVLTLNLGGGIIDSRLGQSSKNITEVFKKASREKAVLFLDEFDYIGRSRDYESKDSAEMKRLVNTVIQLIDQLPNDTLLIGATNHSEAIDIALLRRFQLRLKYEKPTDKLLDRYYDSLIDSFPEAYVSFERLYDISYAEAKDLAYRAIKNNIIEAKESELTLEHG
ncbi:MAG: ATP-binding protein [Flavobacteriales bacterium]|nr:ATP-binding protein [Flavobacteriales bacterium]